ncbi:photosystem I reaction center subunit V, chloroplastic-like [Chenopodium quinoa]|uniref:photosystem I reaction center subunit V, chloroplastic-like n=1 Tax=Chenopodium quinoa TaxID=63459 RepID=UPI000B776E52|nr:photosystem I reaction center subunit V, chloroplastic-like [Chenopodium quinoa]
MAAATATAALSSSSLLAPCTTKQPQQQQQQLIKCKSFAGLRPLQLSSNISRSSSSLSMSGKRRAMTCRAELNPSLVISLSTGLSLFLGRFVFFNFQRENMAKQVPEQNGMTHFEAGDTRAKEYVSLLKSNDPVGFNIVDVLAWGSIGHIVAYYILATASNGYDPNFF